jgi:hypothetical protein
MADPRQPIIPNPLYDSPLFNPGAGREHLERLRPLSVGPDGRIPSDQLMRPGVGVGGTPTIHPEERKQMLGFLNQQGLDINDPYLKLKLKMLSETSKDPSVRDTAYRFSRHVVMDELPRNTQDEMAPLRPGAWE